MLVTMGARNSLMNRYNVETVYILCRYCVDISADSRGPGVADVDDEERGVGHHKEDACAGGWV